mmetsp:Transcript_2702/g.4063  ORF Transcript_2702/g.4063 Transcript_2702/m.4063 type:complete len:152 (-) Transcript_2702:223-678(-)
MPYTTPTKTHTTNPSNGHTGHIRNIRPSDIWDSDVIIESNDSDDDNNFPDIDILPPLCGFGDNNRRSPLTDCPANNLFPSQNEREDLRLDARERAYRAAAQNFRCGRPECMISAENIGNPRLIRQQAHSNREVARLHCTRCGSVEQYMLYY